jgi:hypothetical protein
MHAHVKAADDYLEKCRAALNDDDADDASGGGGEAEARAARLESLRR